MSTEKGSIWCNWSISRYRCRHFYTFHNSFMACAGQWDTMSMRAGEVFVKVTGCVVKRFPSSCFSKASGWGFLPSNLYLSLKYSHNVPTFLTMSRIAKLIYCRLAPPTTALPQPAVGCSWRFQTRFAFYPRYSGHTYLRYSIVGPQIS